MSRLEASTVREPAASPVTVTVLVMPVRFHLDRWFISTSFLIN